MIFIYDSISRYYFHEFLAKIVSSRSSETRGNMMVHYITIYIITAFCFQFVCEHRRSKKDPHPSCKACRQASGLQLCTPQETCDCCQGPRLDRWTILLKSRRKRLWWRQRKEDLCTMSTPAPPAGDQGQTVPPPTLSLAEPLPTSPHSRDAPSQEVLEG